MDQTSNRTIESLSYFRSGEESSHDHPRAYLTTELEFQTILLPGNPNKFGTNHPPLQTLDDDLEPRVLEKPWKPSDGRSHSWSEADRKHELQARLLNVEEGVNHGFTET
ncbi:hypothetical protein P170DRAFT_439741, partial [Aspergillus steynii IBT 23096]